MPRSSSIGAVAAGASAGGIKALRAVLDALPEDFALPVFIVQHFPADTDISLPDVLGAGCRLPVFEAVDKAPINGGCVYVAPPGYHMMIEKGRTLALSTDEHVHYSRPSIDVLFESAARVYGDKLIGILLTGANDDGAQGLRAIREGGGFVMVQEPTTAESSTMPIAAIQSTSVDVVASPSEIGTFLARHEERLPG